MAQRTYQDIQREADRLFGKGASDQKFEWRRAQQAAAGLDLEQKTRSGLAGIYDRNKGLVQAALPTLAGILVPGAGALAGGLIGGLAKGLDRPGEGGVKMDWGQAGRGALTGAGLGAAGAAARTGLQNLMTPNAPAAAPAGPTTAFDRASGQYVPKGTEFNPVSQGVGGFEPTTMAKMPGASMGPVTPPPAVTSVPASAQAALPPAGPPRGRMTDVFNMGPEPVLKPVTSVPTSARMPLPAPGTGARPSMSSILGGMPMSDVANANAGGRQPGILGRIGGAMMRRPEIPMAIGQTILGYQQGKQQQDQAEREFKASEEERKRRQQAQEALAQLLMPLFQQQVQQMGQGRQPQRG